ncbi:ead/Ea22-like family protein [Brachybacterium muris]|uniref:ead/Ea22-like family protein n=1 Tax=Brachybacterium muris TaxID=219301 RepID=UPI0021A57084|nr:ead/Ea22-like family protein [Brachybacterium muris]
MTVQQIDRDQLRALASGATPGPWSYPGEILGLPCSTVFAGDPKRTHAAYVAAMGPHDGAFIAAARTAVPALLDMLDQAEQRIRDLTQEVQDERGACLDQIEQVQARDARIKAVRELHSPSDEQVIMGDCAAEECDHQEIEDCPTEPFTVCAECYRAAIELNPYYGEQGVDDVAWPCPTIHALDGEQ